MLLEERKSHQCSTQGLSATLASILSDRRDQRALLESAHLRTFLAISGNIAVGKSSLTTLLSKRWSWQSLPEPVDTNLYLDSFYQDMARWSFQSQACFLVHRARQHLSIAKQNQSVIQDRTLYEDSEVFARNLYQQGLMDARDYRLYRELYEMLSDLLPPPDLIVYLRASVSTLWHRIFLRDRAFERRLSREYLQQLNELYDEWAFSFELCPVLTICADEIDFVQFPDHLDRLVIQIEDALAYLGSSPLNRGQVDH
jgi:deoxyadenosine/deoxycytidine kinase